LKIERIELAAFMLLGIGAILLILTFYMAFTLIISELGIISALNLSEALGEILGPIAEAIIKVMYLGVMGWTGSIATIRAIQLIREARRVPQPETEQTQQPSPEKEEKTKA
jgi:hypothetical protein